MTRLSDAAVMTSIEIESSIRDGSASRLTELLGDASDENELLSKVEASIQGSLPRPAVDEIRRDLAEEIIKRIGPKS